MDEDTVAPPPPPPRHPPPPPPPPPHPPPHPRLMSAVNRFFSAADGNISTASRTTIHGKGLQFRGIPTSCAGIPAPNLPVEQEDCRSMPRR